MKFTFFTDKDAFFKKLSNLRFPLITMEYPIELKKGVRGSFFRPTASAEINSLNLLCESQLPALVNWQTSQLESLRSWAIIHHGYGSLYFGKVEDAANIVDQVKRFNALATNDLSVFDG